MFIDKEDEEGRSQQPQAGALAGLITEVIRTIEDYPKKGISFKDVMPILGEPKIYKAVCDQLASIVKDCGATALMVPEARGFIFGSCVAYTLGLPLIPARKAGKLPPPVLSMTYELEYGSAEIQVPANSIKESMKVCILDDLLASGGTANAMARIVTSQKAKVAGFVFIFELSKLSGREAIQKNEDQITPIQVIAKLD